MALITQYDEAANHNGGDLHFGPDGYLYATFGDEGFQNDSLNNSQRINKDFFSGIIRIDVDKRPGSLTPNAHPSVTSNYAVPPDNPFVGATSFNGVAVNPATVRTEFWAVGLRNPWRISFDRQTGWLWCGDVGGSLREEINLITRGGNYGWAYVEGTLAGPKVPPAGFQSIPPIQEYPHGTGTTRGNSVTGGVVYRGLRMSQISGAYIFADYVTGNIWALRYDGQTFSPYQHLVTDTAIAGFGLDPRNGDVLMADQDNDTIKKLDYNATVTGTPIPPTLAQAGVFSNLASLAVHPGIVPYEVNVPFWSDGALKRRWFSIPDTNRFMGFHPEANWSFPTGMVWVKHFEIETTNGVPSLRRRLETRLLVRNAGGGYGVTYRWGASLTNATLVAEAGLNEDLAIQFGGSIRTQVWRYPARTECLQCHTAAGGFALGFSTAQLHRDHAYGAVTQNQIRAMAGAGYFSNTVNRAATLPALARADDTSVSIAYRARSYLHANCGYCHRPGGGSVGFWDGRITTPLDRAGIVDGALNRPFTNAADRVVARGAPQNSMILHRMGATGPTRMPPIGPSVPDTNGIRLLRAWIVDALPGYASFSDWRQAYFTVTNAPEADPGADPDEDGAPNRLEHLAGTNPLEPGDEWEAHIALTGQLSQVTFLNPADRGVEVQATEALANSNAWRRLDIPSNIPRYPAAPTPSAITDPEGASNRFYRLRIFSH